MLRDADGRACTHVVRPQARLENATFPRSSGVIDSGRGTARAEDAQGTYPELYITKCTSIQSKSDSLLTNDDGCVRRRFQNATCRRSSGGC
jgi:hypothetical protein